jgi:hypothetical protein
MGLPTGAADPDAFGREVADLAGKVLWYPCMESPVTAAAGGTIIRAVSRALVRAKVRRATSTRMDGEPPSIRSIWLRGRHARAADVGSTFLLFPTVSDETS